MKFSFNELSSKHIKSPKNIEDFYGQIQSFIKLVDLDRAISITFTESFSSQNFNGYGNIHKLINDSNLSEEEKTHIISFIMNAPYSKVSNGDQYLFNGSEVEGFHYSAVNSCKGISIPGSGWDQHQYTIIQRKLCEITASINDININVLHLGDLGNVTGSWIEPLIPVTTFNNEADFLINIPKKYPNVIISENAKRGLIGFNKGKLNQLERAMDIFQQYCDNHWGDSFNKAKITRLGISIKDESPETMKVDKYYRQRNFINENGNIENMPFHFNISDDHRGNIKATGDKKIFIAYLGYHLDTVRHN